VLEIARKQIHCVDLVLMIPNQLEKDQRKYICERYHILFIFPNRQNVDCTVHTGHVATDRTIHKVIQLMWQGDLVADMGGGDMVG
jgi:hypothetical protein